MAQSSGSTFAVTCPCCSATLQVDAETQTVLHHREPERKPSIENLQTAVQQLKGDEARRNDAFDKSFASLLSGERVREKKFEELLRQAKDDDSGAPPKRPFDLD